MSFTQTLIGMGAVGLVAQSLLSAVLPDATGIFVHSLSYDNGMVTQDRTVVTGQPSFYAQWAVNVVDAETGQMVPECAGNGAAPYREGRKSLTFTLSDWTGNDNCTPDVLIDGRKYELQAVWSWGDKNVSASQGFVK
jgi:hypothetical protein